MNARTLSGIVFVSLVAAGCGHMETHGGGGGELRERPPTTQECKTPTCQIDVDVVTRTRNGAAINTIVVVDELLVLKDNHGQGGNGVRIIWHVTNPQYCMRDDSIQFYEDAARNQFRAPGTGGDGKEFHWTDANTDSSRHYYGYQLKVYNCRTGDWIPLDPGIWNGY